MKTWNCIVMLALMWCTAASAEQTDVKARTDSVKVYLQGAEMFHSTKVKLSEGKNIVKVRGISGVAVENSLRAGLSREAEIMSVALKRDIAPLAKTPAMVAIEDSVKDTDYRVREIGNEITALEQELEMLKENRSIGGSNGINAAQLKEMADFFRSRFTEVNNRILKLDGAIETLAEKKNSMNQRLIAITTKDRTNSNESYVEVVINSNSAMTTDIFLTYYITQASWVPEYNLKIKNLESMPELQYKAKVRQNSGIDWDDVGLTLSTGNPLICLDMPKISTLFANLVNPAKSGYGVVGVSSGTLSTGAGWSVRGARASETQVRVDGYEVSATLPDGEIIYKSKGGFSAEYGDVPGGKPVDYDDMQGTVTGYSRNVSCEFRPELRYTIPSDDRYNNVVLGKKEAEAEYEYYARPNWRESAFVIAKIKNRAELNLMYGNANVYYENSYNGRTVINPETTDSVLSVAVAADRDVVVKRTPVRKYSEGKFLSSNKEKSFGFEIAIRNNKTKPVKIVVEDQVPVSAIDEISVEVLEVSGGSHNKKTGIIKWVLELKPGESVSKELAYTMTIPGNSIIEIK